MIQLCFSLIIDNNFDSQKDRGVQIPSGNGLCCWILCGITVLSVLFVNSVNVCGPFHRMGAICVPRTL